MRGAKACALALLLGIGVGASARGNSEKDLKDARTAFTRALGGSDAEPLAAGTRLSKLEPPRGALSLVELGLKGERRAALAAERALGSVTDVRVARALAAEVFEIRDPRARRLLCSALATVAGDDVNHALARALGDPDLLVRAAAARAIGLRDASVAPLVSGTLRELARRDPSVRVREAANASLGRLRLGSLPGYDVELMAGGLPSRFFVSRVAFVLDASAKAQLADYAAQTGIAAVGSNVPGARIARKAGPGPAPEATSAYEITAVWLARALQHLTDDQTFQLVQFHATTCTFDSKYVTASGRETARGIEWLKSPLRSDPDRDVARALGEVLSASVVPEEIYLFLCGLPAGREAAASSAVFELAGRAWDKGVVLNVTLFEPHVPSLEGDSQHEQVERARAAAERKAFASNLAAMTGGRFTSVSLEPFAAPDVASQGAPGARPAVVAGTAGPQGSAPVPAAEASPAGASSAGASSAAGASTPSRVKLVNGRVPYSELVGLRHTLDSALNDEGDGAEALSRDLAACPDDGTAELAVKALLQGPLGAQRAALEGFATNREPRVHAQVAQILRSQTDPVKALLVARALGAMPGLDVTRSLALEAEFREGSGDLPRVLLSALARRPVNELAAITSYVSRATAHERRGLAGFWARRVVEEATGKATALSLVPAERLLPDHWPSGITIAFVVDAQDRDLDAVFLREKDDSKRARVWTRREMIVRELGRSLSALAAAHGSATCLLLGESGRGWDDRAQPLTKARVDEALEFLRSQLHAIDREVGPPLEKELNDPSIEEVWVLALGTPVRSDADDDTAGVRKRLATLSMRRGVSVHVVLPLGSIESSSSSDVEFATADRADEIRRLTRFWLPLAEATSGQLFLRERVMLPGDPPLSGNKPGHARDSDISPVTSPAAAAARPQRPVPFPVPSPAPPGTTPGDALAPADSPGKR